jgi:hypothetical protein
MELGCDVDADVDWRVQYRRPTSTKDYDTETEDLSRALHFAILNPNPAVLERLLARKPELEARAKAPAAYSALELALTRQG